MKSLKEIYNAINRVGSNSNGFWGINNKRNANLIQEDLTYENFVKEMSTNFDFTIDGMAIREKNNIPLAINWLRENYPDLVLSEISKYVHPDVVVSGTSVNHMQVNIMKNNLTKHYDLTECNSVLEIGAGYGAFAREILLSNDKMKYVIIDFSESLLASFSFLFLEFPNKKHIFYGGGDNDIDYDILYIPIGALDFYLQSDMNKDFDLFVNSASFGEMKNDVVLNYYNIITNILNVKRVYWLNRFLNIPPFAERKSENMCMLGIPKNWHIKHWEYLPTFLRCQYIMPYHAKMTEIFATIEDDFDGLTENNDELFNAWNRFRLDSSEENALTLKDAIIKIEPQAEELLYLNEI